MSASSQRSRLAADLCLAAIASSSSLWRAAYFSLAILFWRLFPAVCNTALVEFVNPEDLNPPSVVDAETPGVVSDWDIADQAVNTAVSAAIRQEASTSGGLTPSLPSCDPTSESLKEGDETSNISPRGPPELTDDLLQPIVAEALRRWSAHTDDVRLSSVEFRIADVPGNGLGLHENQVIWIDLTAAGQGWFIDQTPEDDVEFAGDARVEGMDLLTVVMHELGHELGHALGIDDHYDASDDVMNGVLSAGIRRLPSSLEAYEGPLTDTVQPRFLVADITTVADSGTPFDEDLPSANAGQAITVTGSNLS